MKKVLALVASTMMLVVGGLFVSCADDGTQDVYLTNLDDLGASYEYYGTFSGTVTSADVSSISLDNAGFGTVEWETNASNEKSNMRGYELTVPYTYKSSSSSTTIYEGSATIYIGKIGSKYYNQEDGKEVTFSSGSPESSSFTISTVTVSGYYDIVFANLSFKRAD